jgi:glycosyltransferase involved in cell wall biosynthesis
MIRKANQSPSKHKRANSPAGRRLRINWVLSYSGLSGGVKSNRLIAEAMVRRGHQVTIGFLIARQAWPAPWRIRRIARELRHLAHRFRGVQPDDHHLASSTARLVPLVADRIMPSDLPDADVTIATWWETAEWIADWPASKGIKAYFIRHHELHGGDPDRVRATYHLPYLKLVIARWLQRLMADDYGDANAVLVPNGVDWSQFHSSPRERQKVPTVGLMYSPKEWKGSDTAFEAIRMVQATMPNLRVVAFGTDEPATSSKTPANLEFHKLPQQSEIARLYQAADCWIVSSVSEGFGMPGLEAAACRCPIVSTRCGGPEDYVEDGVSGCLVPVSDAAAMSEALRHVLQLDTASWQRMSEASYAIARRFDWDRSAEILERALIAAIDRAAHDPRRAPASKPEEAHSAH